MSDAEGDFPEDQIRASTCRQIDEDTFIRRAGPRGAKADGFVSPTGHGVAGASTAYGVDEQRPQPPFIQIEKMQSLATFSAGVAHEFNNLLFLIQLAVDDLKGDGAPSALQAEAVGDITGAVERATTLTRKLALFHGVADSRPRVLDLNAWIDAKVAALTGVLGEQITLSFNAAPMPMDVLFDPALLDQLVSSLVANACEAMPEGGQLLIALSAVDVAALPGSEPASAHDGPFAQVSVTDSGCGIPPESIGRVFDPFFTTKRETRNLGLGLSTVFGIVRQHDGRVSVSSVLGQGTTIRVCIPRLSRTASQAADWSAGRVGSSYTPPALGGGVVV